MYTNSHTHIFNIRCTPPKSAGVPFAGLISKSPALLGLTPFILSKIPSKGVNRLANFLKVGRMKTQKQIFNLLKTYYRNDVRHVVLTMDMHYMGAGKSEIDYASQILQVKELKLLHKNTLIPFLAIDPRRFSGKTLVDYVAKNVENHGFGGVKLYPPLGFFPFDPRLTELYAYLQDMQIPIMSHCSQGGVYFQNKAILHDQIYPLDLRGNRAKREFINGETNLLDLSEDAKELKRFLWTSWGKGKRNNKFKSHFSNPLNYINVLNEFPKLKICLAHFGGDGEIEDYVIHGNKNSNWHTIIKKLMERYDNLYTDISYALWNKKAWEPIKSAIQNPDIGNRVLFGTDFYMTLQKKEEAQLVRDFRSSISPELFDTISKTNPNTYLQTRLE